MDERTLVDIRQYSFDEFVSFLFARDVQFEAEQSDLNKWDPWDRHIEVIFDSEQVSRHYVRLFTEPGFLLERFSKAQLEDGFWAIQGPNLDCSVLRILESTPPVASREQCVSSMFYLFRDFFAKEPLETAGSMWWDSLCFSWHRGNRERSKDGEDLRLQNVIFQTLVRILDLDSEFCHRASLHGLGHLQHPDTEKVIEEFIGKHPSLTDAQKAYALAAARFKVL